MCSGESAAPAAGTLASLYTSTESSGRQLSQDFSTIQWRTHSFTPTAGTCTGIGLKLFRDANITGDMIVRFETDSSGDPSGTLVHANATLNITVDGLGTSGPALFSAYNFASSFSVSNVLQWMVFKPAFTSSASELVYAYGQNVPDAGMVVKRTLDSGSNWSTRTIAYNYEVYGS